MRAEAVAPRIQDHVGAARALSAAIRAQAASTEAGRRVPSALVTELRDAGLFRMGIPASCGGDEVDVATMLQAIEETSYADGSVGWCVMLGTTSGVVAAYLPAAEAREIFGPQTIAGGVFAPKGRAEPTDGGFSVSGRWPFASGCQHCDWLMGGYVIDDVPYMALFPRDAVEIVDTWDVSGLRGTGSHDIAVSNLFVPASRTMSLVAGDPVESGRLYRFPIFGLLALGISAVALGIARRAIDELIELAGGKTPTFSTRELRNRPAVQIDVARAEALYGSARAFLHNAVATAWDADELTVALRARLRLAATNAARMSADAVDLCYDAGGGSSIYASSPLQRCFRDVHALTQHIMVAPPTYELVGRIALGVEANEAML